MTRQTRGIAGVKALGRRIALAAHAVLTRRLATLPRAEDGVSAVEFGLAAPVLLGLLIPLADLGIAYSDQIQVQQAAQAGAQYASLHPWNSGSVTAISNAVTAATTLSGINATPAPRQSCGCPSGSTITTATCGSTCSNGETAGYYVVVTAQAPYTTVLPYSALGSSMTLSAQSTVRIQ